MILSTSDKILQIEDANNVPFSRHQTVSKKKLKFSRLLKIFRKLEDSVGLKSFKSFRSNAAPSLSL